MEQFNMPHVHLKTVGHSGALWDIGQGVNYVRCWSLQAHTNAHTNAEIWAIQGQTHGLNKSKLEGEMFPSSTMIQIAWILWITVIITTQYKSLSIAPPKHYKNISN